MQSEVLVFAAETVVSGTMGERGAEGIVHLRLPADSPAEDLPFAGSRRMARVSRLALAAGSAALASAGVDAGAGPGRDSMSLTFCSGFGALDHTEAFYRQVLGYEGPYPSPSLFAESVINAPAGHLSIALGIRGSVRTLAVGRSNGLPALCHVLEDIAAGDAQTALFVAADSPTPFCLEVLARCDDSLARTPGEGTPAGEGAVALLLGRRGSLDREPLAAITVCDTSQSPWDPAAALDRLSWPEGRPWQVRTSSSATLLAGLEQRAVRRHWPGVTVTTAAWETGFLFGAQGALEVALAARAAAPARTELVTGVDPLGSASLVGIGGAAA